MHAFLIMHAHLNQSTLTAIYQIHVVPCAIISFILTYTSHPCHHHFVIKHVYVTWSYKTYMNLSAYVCILIVIIVLA